MTSTTTPTHELGEPIHARAGGVQPAVSWGPSSIIALAVTAIAGAGAIVAGIRGADAQMIAGGTGSVLGLVTLVSSRTAQAIALARTWIGAHRDNIDAGLDAIGGTPTPPVDDPEAEEVADGELPDDATEFASPPPDETNMPVQPSQGFDLDAEREAARLDGIGVPAFPSASDADLTAIVWREGALNRAGSPRADWALSELDRRGGADRDGERAEARRGGETP